jgi:hypothetical protein
MAINLKEEAEEALKQLKAKGIETEAHSITPDIPQRSVNKEKLVLGDMADPKPHARAVQWKDEIDEGERIHKMVTSSNFDWSTKFRFFCTK